MASRTLSEEQKRRVCARLGARVTATAQDARSQVRNRELALERLEARLASALKVPRRRHATRPTAASRRRRSDAKRRRADIKRRGGRRRRSRAASRKQRLGLFCFLQAIGRPDAALLSAFSHQRISRSSRAAATVSRSVSRRVVAHAPAQLPARLGASRRAPGRAAR